MDRGAPEYSQSGLPSPHPSVVGDNQSKASSVDPASVAPYAGQQDARSTAYSNSATPTSEYSVYPPTSRSGTFPEMQRQYPPVTNANGGGSADPSIAAASPTYTTHGQYSPYAAPPQDMAAHGYHQHPGTPGLYAQPRPDWGATASRLLGTSRQLITFSIRPRLLLSPRAARISFVPIPGAQQHKRPRRRYEEIERMYRCGWQGCEKAYGTLNHLNAHVTMQGHGPKRVPEEFKEVRRLWKARKKEAEAREKAAEEERQRQAAAAAAAAAQNGGAEQQAPADPAQPPTTYATTGAVQLPPIGFQPRYPGQSTGGIQQQVPEYSYPNYSPTSPYGQSNQQMYNQPNGGQGGGSH
ncbi:0fa960ca-1c3c-4c2d-acb6-72f4dc034b51 [Thermothielavioides terrestris]|uniref:0fa960ca-1c3c-4c2d-acb6-72f4dc034b51 n=1 Tax=Thermothielavioides terrestris TaxID=2587410 RepID=A0A446BU72_9PEZI|nr:0fa960ca-1c3c-4c2d-acb6-72f4dc034b51 [Thermothielavioides terrestris]